MFWDRMGLHKESMTVLGGKPIVDSSKGMELVHHWHGVSWESIAWMQYSAAQLDLLTLHPAAPPPFSNNRDQLLAILAGICL